MRDFLLFDEQVEATMDVLNQPRPQSAKILSFDGAMAKTQQTKQTPQQFLAEAKAAAAQAAQSTADSKAILDAITALVGAIPPPAPPPSRLQQYREIINTGWPVFVGLLTVLGLVLHLYVKDQINDALGPFNARLQTQGETLAKMSGQIEKLSLKYDKPKQTDPALLAQGTSTPPQTGPAAGKDGKRNSPGDVLTSIRTDLARAQKQRQKLPVPQLADFKKQVQSAPQSAKDYWMTVAAVINYQSFLNQLNNHAPDPDKVAHRCAFYTEEDPKSGIHFHNNVVSDTQHVNDCIVDLDTNGNTILDAVIQDSVVHYHGGKINFAHAVFINCRFIVDIKDPVEPSRQNLLLALMNSDQIQFNVSAVG